MTRSNVNKRLDIAVARAAEVYPNLAKRRISPHSVRHYSESRTMPSAPCVTLV
jgi:integrase/recombinase XerD